MISVFTIRLRLVLLSAGLLLLPGAALAAPAQAATPAPGWSITSVSLPTNLAPGSTNATDADQYLLTLTNVGGATSSGTISIVDTLPAGVSVAGNPTGVFDTEDASDVPLSCSSAAQTLTCTTATELAPNDVVSVSVPIDVSAAASGSLVNQVTVSGGGALTTTSVSQPTAIDSSPPPFDFLPKPAGFDVSLTGADGLPVTQAGSHPYQLGLGINLPLGPLSPGGDLTFDGAVKDVSVDLPEGLVANPNATPVRCTEAQLEDPDSGFACPAASQVGTVTVVSLLFGTHPAYIAVPLYNIVPPPGHPAEFGTYVRALGSYVHIFGALKTGGGYALSAGSTDIIAGTAVSGILTTLWGDPSDSSHEPQRGRCAGSTAPPGGCPAVDPGSSKPFLTMPSACSGPLSFTATVDSWQEPGDFHSATAETHDGSSNPVGVTGCDQLDFSPTITAKPDSTSADSPAGFDFGLHLPQHDSFDTLAESTLKKAVVTLPPGASLNPSAADGLDGCTPAQISLNTAAEPSCPDASKVGTVSIKTPLISDPLTGSVYLATPHDNPFDALAAGYIVAEADGALIKLAGKFDLDPQTGQITASFDNNPQLPFDDFNLHFFGGDRGNLATPQSCGSYPITTQLSSWSAADPDNPTPAETATPGDAFSITSGPGGGPCPNLTDPSKFTPGFQAGTVTPLAGSYSPFVLKITRPDGQQYLKQIHIDMPPGLVAKLAGVPRCAQAQITPGVGGSTNCPAASQIGTVNVGAGAGSPFFLKDQPVYLTDGYAGAPYGIAIDTHALAGPFDLGHVVIRSTLNVDQDDAQVHIDSEQIPDILDGIPLRIRSVAVNVNRPGFILNPTNCDPMQVTGTVTGGGADFNAPGDDTVKPVSTPFQVAGCGGLAFNPSLTGTILNGTQGIHRSDHPNLSFNLGYQTGNANLRAVSVLLPQAFQIDQANLGNICSETNLVQNQCAGKNTVGTASATTPILDSTLSGPVYAVSGSGGLPKLAVILRGPPTDPITLVVRGITTTVGARIENTFPLVPDAPVTSFNLTLNGGPAGYLVNNTNVCGKNVKRHGKKKFVRTALNADANFTAQDDDTRSQTVPISAQCPSKKGKKGKKSSAHRKHHH